MEDKKCQLEEKLEKQKHKKKRKAADAAKVKVENEQIYINDTT